MTREEAYNRIDAIIAKYEIDDEYVTITNPKDYDALRMARELLEQEPCEDAISRTEAITALKADGLEEIFRNLGVYPWNVIAIVPSVHPKLSESEDAISRQVVLDIIEKELFKGDAISEIEKLPSVTPKPKTGHWIAQDIYNCHTNFKCSECGYIHNFIHLYGKPTADYTYCPICGAKMEASE